MAETPEDPGGPPGRTALARWQLSCNNIILSQYDMHYYNMKCIIII